jgi:hypothetical protein
MRNKLVLSLAALAIGAVSQADVVLNHIPLNMADVSTLNSSQDFEASFDAFDSGVIEDFSVTALQTNITEVQVMMGGYNGFTSGAQWSSVTGFRVNFYTSPAAGGANLTGNAGNQLVLSGGATIVDPGWSLFNGTVRRVVLPINVNLPGPGTYWVGVTAVMDAGSAVAQIGVADNLVTTGGDNSNQINPGGGFGLPPGNFNSLGLDSAYRVEATAVPEPGSMIALGLGAAALAARRRRKVA